MRQFRPRSRLGLVGVSLALLALALPIAAMNASASEPRALVASITPLPANDVVVNQVITTGFDVALAQQHANELPAFIASLTNTASANYHQFLTPSEYAAEFGASPRAVAAVRRYFASYGLHTGALSAGHNILQISGTTTDVARALDAQLETVRLSNGTLAARLASRATVPHALKNDVLAVGGLDATQESTASLSATHVVSSPSSCAAAGSTTGTVPNANGYTAQQQEQMYGLNTALTSGDDGAGQTIAVYELANYNTYDLAAFESCYGIAPTVNQFTVDGGPVSADNAGDSPEEATLDVEEAAVLAPGATIDVYLGTNTGPDGNGPIDTYATIASDDLASVVTTSWGNCESASTGSVNAEQSIFEQMAAQGQTVVSAAGDNGSDDCEVNPTREGFLAVDDPASQPYVTGVGGLTVTSISPLAETVWNNNGGAGGGGESTLWSIPAWQNTPTINPADSAYRMVPDLSVMADPFTGFIEDYTGGLSPCRTTCNGWQGIGGTSIGSPIVSAIVAVAAQSCGGSRLGFINPQLYKMYANPSVQYFNDVTSGSNDVDHLGGYSAGPGYDMASGLGSPNPSTFISGLCPPAYYATNSSFALSSKSGVANGTGPTVTATLRDVNNDPIAYGEVNVTAAGTSGLVGIDGSYGNTTAGQATDNVVTNANGTANFDIESTVAQSVTLTVTYRGATVYTTSLSFALSAKPSTPSITKLTALAGGFALTISPPTKTGGSAITYQYSINAGKTWITIANGARSVNVTKLTKGKSYTVIVRARNAIGASNASAAKKVVTRS